MIAVLVFVAINFALVLVPALFEVVRPQGTEDAIKRFSTDPVAVLLALVDRSVAVDAAPLLCGLVC